MAAHVRSAPRYSSDRGLLGTTGFYALLALVALLPLTTSITRGLVGRTYALTDEVYRLFESVFERAKVRLAPWLEELDQQTDS